DGMNTTLLDGPVDLVVEPKPPRPFIIEPADGEAIQAGSRLVLQASAVSPQSGLLNDESLRWYLGDRFLGTGSQLEVSGLPADRQELRLEVTDADGLRTVETRVVYLDANSVAVLGE